MAFLPLRVLPSLRKILNHRPPAQMILELVDLVYSVVVERG